nr:zinc finger protein 724-like isoform X2 [Leptinotarsa decemlineata]
MKSYRLECRKEVVPNLGSLPFVYKMNRTILKVHATPKLLPTENVHNTSDSTSSTLAPRPIFRELTSIIPLQVGDKNVSSIDLESYPIYIKRYARNEDDFGGTKENTEKLEEFLLEDNTKQVLTEKSETNQYIKLDSKVACRTCTTTCGSFYSINSNIPNFKTTIKDMVILLIPQMKTLLDDDDIVCANCRTVLLQCVKFIYKCLCVESERINNLSGTRHTEDNPHLENCKDVNSLSIATDPDTDYPFDNEHDSYSGDFETELDMDQDMNKNSHHDISQSDHDISQSDHDVFQKSLPDEILDHNRLISTNHLSSKGLNVFSSILASNNVQIFQYSQDLKKTTKGKRIILIGSTFKCNKCSRYFVTPGIYCRHLKSHKRRAKQKLEREKSKKLNLKKKKIVFKHEPQFKCGVCNLRFYSRNILRDHMKLHPPLICEKCGKGFPTREQMRSHELVHNDPNSFICEVCGKSFKTSTQFAKHKIIHENRIYLCNRCAKTFNTGLKLRRHLKYTHGEGLINTNLWPCKECEKVFTVRNRLVAHNRLMHLKDDHLKCSECGQGFCRSDYLKRHMRSHVRNEERDQKSEKCVRVSGGFQCQICKKVLKSMQNLKLHIKSHGILTRFSCKYCNMTFKIKYQRTRHEKQHENLNFIYRCEICWKRMDSQEELDQHVLTHKNSKYKCESCEQSFARKHMLEDHFVKNHSKTGDAEEEMKILLSAAI